MKTLFTLLFFSMFSFSYAQTFQWAKSYGGTGDDNGLGVCVDDDGNVYTLGSITGTVNFDTTSLSGNIFIAKHSPNGKLIWAKTNTVSGVSVINSKIVEKDGFLYFTGAKSNGSNTNIYISKFDTAGHFIWDLTTAPLTPGNNRGLGLAIENNLIYVTGFFQNTVNFGGIFLSAMGSGSFPSDAFVAKYDTAGICQWVKRAGGTNSNSDQGRSVAVDRYGDIVVTGYFGGNGTFGNFSVTQTGLGYDVFTAKYDTQGNCLWVRQGVGNSNNIGFGLVTDSNKNVFITGRFSGASIEFSGTTLTGGPIFIVKYDQNGNLIWAKTGGGGSQSEGMGVAVDSLENLYVAGVFYLDAIFDTITVLRPSTPPNGLSAFVAKYDSTGIIQWVHRSISTNAINHFNHNRSIAIDKIGNAYVTGNFTSTTHFENTVIPTAGGSDIFIAKLNDFVTDFEVSSTSLCAGASFYGVFYGIEFNSNNNFTLELSDSSGSFLNPTIVGSLAGTLGDTIYGIIPFSIATGQNYRLRVKSSSPEAIGREVNIIITAIPIAQVSYTGNTVFCQGGNLQLTAQQEPGFNYQWLRNGNFISNATNSSYTASQSGMYVIRVSNSCDTVFSVPVEVIVHPLPNVTISPFNSVCLNEAPFALSGGTPSGGIYSGPGVSFPNNFNPSAAGTGFRNITYTFTDQNGCTNSANRNIQVMSIPSVSLAIPSQICLQDTALLLDGGNPKGGTFSGTGVSGNYFEPAIAGEGDHLITYVYTNSSGCSDTAALSINVDKCLGI
ncbi:MAG: hypothetical protein H0X62_12510, partial [Bacteroidetes bacterium]|nr:hypothetical protein [Bacteroidota bacterium]